MQINLPFFTFCIENLQISYFFCNFVRFLRIELCTENVHRVLRALKLKTTDTESRE